MLLLLLLLLACLLGLGVGAGPGAATWLLDTVISGCLLRLGATGRLLLVGKVLQHLLRLLRPGCRSAHDHAGMVRLPDSTEGLLTHSMFPWQFMQGWLLDSLLPEAAGGVLEPVDLILKLWIAAVWARCKNV